MHHSLTNQYNFFLVLLSFIIALLASYTSLNLARKVITSERWLQRSWLVCSAIVMGVGIWSMHFIAMLAFHLPANVTYDISIVSVSILVAIVGALIGLFVTFQAGPHPSKFYIGGTIMGLAISAMHYIGMAALQHVSISYMPITFILSIAIAIIASITALYFFFNWNNRQRIAISGLIMAAAITGMHYTGMASAIITFPHSPTTSSNAVTMDFYVVAMYVAFGTLLIFAISFISSLSVDRRLAEQIALKASILESAIDCIFMFKTQGWIIEFNPAAESIFGYTRKEALKRTLFDLLFPSHQDGQDAALLYQLLEKRDDSIIGKRFEITAYRSDRSKFPAEIIITDNVYGGKTIYTAYLRDLTEIRKSEELIQQLAYFDHLTGLPNRNQFNELYQQELDQAQLRQGTLGVMYLDIYRFKGINDTFGHQVGDRVLQKFSELISCSLATNGMASRLSGDEFVILVPQGNRDTMAKQAQNIITLLDNPVDIDGKVLYVSTNIGISMYPNDGDSPELLLKNADQAMYVAKEQGRNNFQFFKPEMKTKYAQRILIEHHLRESIDRNELSLVYQPKFDIHSGDLVGIEALLRWENAHLGSISPKEFIPIAEESRQIVKIGQWVLRTATKQMKKWQEAGLNGVSIAINVSDVQFHQEDFVQMMVDIVQENDLEPKYVELEIKESIDLNRPCMVEKLHDLHRKGFRIVIDDFGTGYSALSYLNQCPIDSIKIDKSFIPNLANLSSPNTLIEALIAMGRSLKLDVIAKGVETEAQYHYLKSHGCQQIQGYLFALPLPADPFEQNYVYCVRAAGS